MKPGDKVYCVDVVNNRSNIIIQQGIIQQTTNVDPTKICLYVEITYPRSSPPNIDDWLPRWHHTEKEALIQAKRMCLSRLQAYQDSIVEDNSMLHQLNKIIRDRNF